MLCLYKLGKEKCPNWERRYILKPYFKKCNNKCSLFQIRSGNVVEQPCLSLLFSPASLSPRVTQLNQLQWLVLWSVPSWDHAPSTVLGLPWFEQTTLVWLVAELRCWDGSTCQSQAHHASITLGAPEPKRNDCLVLHKCGISPRRKCFDQGAEPLRAPLKYSTVCVCVWLHACVVRAGLGLLLSLSVSLHLSHDFPDLGSPGVSHLGHQLHLQVNCSSKWSAKQCRKKKGGKKPTTVLASPAHDKIRPKSWQ